MFKISYQFIMRNKKKSLSIMLSIILSVALLVGIGSLIRSANISKSNYYAELNGNYQYTYKLDAKQIKKLPNILQNSKTHIKNESITTELYFTEIPKVMTVIACTQSYLEMNSISLLKGRLPDAKDEIVLEEWMLSNLGLKEGIGETLKIEHIDFKIVGIVSDSFTKYNEEIIGYTVISENTSDADAYTLYVNFDLSTNIEKESLQFMEELGCKAEERRANWDVIEPLGITAPISENESVVAFVKKLSMDEDMTTILFAIFSAFIIYSILNVTVMQRMSQYGILESMGAGFRHLFEIIFLEVFMLFMIGFPIGCIVGIAVSKGLYRKFNRIFLSADIKPATFVISRKVIFNAFIFLLVLLIIVTIKTVLQIRKTNNMDIIKNSNQRLLKDRRILANERGHLLQYVSHRYMILKTWVFVGMLFSLAIGGIVFCGTDYVIQATKQENEMTMKADDGLYSDYFISMQNSTFNQGLSESKISELKCIKGIDSLYPVKHFLGATFIPSAKYKNKHFFDPANEDERIKDYFNGICTEEENGEYLVKGNIYGYSYEMLNVLNKYLIEGKIYPEIMENENGIILCLPQDGGSLKFDAIDFEPGDTIRIKVPRSLEAEGDVLKFQSGDELYEVKEFKIVATVKRVMAHNDYFVGPSGLDIIMTNAMMSREFNIDNYNMVSIIKQDSASGMAIAEEIRKIVQPIERCVFIDFTSLIEKENMNLRQREVFFVGLSVIIVLVSMFHILNSMNYLIMSRKQDFGILRAMGVSDSMFRKMLIREGILYGIYASGIMFLGTVIIIGVLYVYLRSVAFLYEPKFFLNWSYLVILGGVNIILSIIAVFISSQSILREKIVECMRKNE